MVLVGIWPGSSLATGYALIPVTASSPVTVALTIGNKSGSASVSATFQ